MRHFYVFTGRIQSTHRGLAVDRDGGAHRVNVFDEVVQVYTCPEEKNGNETVDIFGLYLNRKYLIHTLQPRLFYKQCSQ